MPSKKAIYELRQQRIALGLCITITCDAPAGINTSDGKRSRYCDPCKAAIFAKRNKPETAVERSITNELGRSNRPSIKYDENGLIELTEQPEFIAFAERFAEVIRKADKPLGCRDVKTIMGITNDMPEAGWLFHACEAHYKTVESVLIGSITRFRYRELREAELYPGYDSRNGYNARRGISIGRQI